LRSGVVLSELIEILSGRMIARWKSNNLTHEDKIANVGVVLAHLSKRIKTSVTAADIVTGDVGAQIS